MTYRISDNTYRFPDKVLGDLFQDGTINFEEAELIKKMAFISFYEENPKTRRENISTIRNLFHIYEIGELISGMQKDNRLYLQVQPYHAKRPYWLLTCELDKTAPGKPFMTDTELDSYL